MKRFSAISVVFTAFCALFLASILRAQDEGLGAAKFSTPASHFRPAWPHRLIRHPSGIRHEMKPPDLLDTVTRNWLSSFRHPEMYLWKNTLTQDQLTATHALTGAVQVVWAQQFGSQFLPSDDAASDIVVDRQGNVYVTGYLTNQPFGADYLTVKYDATGRKLWEACYNGDAKDDDFAAAMAMDVEGNVYVTGSSKTEAHAADFVTIKYNTNGATQWTARYDFQNGAGKSYDAATALAIDGRGNVYVSGWSENDFATVKYNATGIEQWRARFPGSGSTEVNAMQVDHFGNVYVAGQNNGAFILVKYNSAGQKEWSSGYSEFIGSRGIAMALALDRRGEVYVTGMYEGLGYPEYLTIKFNRAGTREWTAFYRGPESCNWNIATALALDDSGAVYVTGESGWFQEACDGGVCVTREDIDYATIKYDRAGVMQWSARYGPAESCSHAAAVNIDRAGNVLVTGNDQQDFVTLKYGGDGAPQWISPCNGGNEAEDAAIASAIDDLGNVYVAGSSMRNQDKDWATMKYNDAGITQWRAHEDSPGNSFDMAKALALDSSGNVFIAGASQNTPDAAAAWTIINYNPAGTVNWKLHGSPVKNFRNTAEKIAIDAEGNSYILASQYEVSRLKHRYGAFAKYDREGRELWRTAFDSTNHEGYSRPTALAIDRSGNIYVTGASQQADFATIKYDTNGSVLWQAHENPGPQFFNGAAAMAIDDSENVYIAGLSDGDGLMIKYNSGGIKQWQARYHTVEAVNRIAAIAVEPEQIGGNILVLAGIGYYSDYLTLKYNRDGAREWEARYSRPGDSFDHPAALAISDLGNVYVTGNAATIKYNQNGTAIWTVATGATALAVDESGNLYTTGLYADSMRTYDTADFFTAKYNALGALQWSARYDGPGNSLDYPVAIALDEWRNVYVAGQSRSDESQHWSFFTTIKYTQNSLAVNEERPNITESFQLAQNFPNPFNPSTRIRYTLAQSGRVTLKIFDILGREIVTLVNAVKSAGEYGVLWSPENLPGGVYIYRLQVYHSTSSGQGFVESKKLVFMP